MSEHNALAAGGLGFAGLSIAALALMPPPPGGKSSAAHVRHYFATHSANIRAASALSILAALLLLCLFAALRRRLAGADLLFAGGVITSAVAVLGGLLQSGLALGQPHLGNDGVLALFWVERTVFYVAPPLAITAAAVGAMLAFRSQLPGWLTGLSGLLAVVAAVGGITNTVSDNDAGGAIGLIGFLLTIIWAAATSIVVLRDRVTPSAP